MPNDTPPPVPQTSARDAEILQEAREWLEMVRLYESEIRKEGAKCLQFRSGDQWNETILMQRGAQRPSLVIDHTGQFVDQVVNDWRRNRIGIEVSPGDDSADTETAQIVDGLIREIEYKSKAHTAYDKAFDQMVGQNRGFLRITTERRKGSFKKDIRIKHIQNPDCVYFDPFACEVDFSDAMRCLVTDRLGMKQYHAEWGKKAPEVDFKAYSTESWYGDWITPDSITIAEWWCVELKPRKICKLTQPIVVIRDGRAVETDTVYNDEYDKDSPLYEGITIKLDADGNEMEDDEPKREVWQYIVNGVQVLDRVKWEGSRIPIKPMYGRELLVNGKKRLYSLISRMLDAQQALNYTVSSGIQSVALAPTAPWIGLIGQFKTNDKQWADANRTPYSRLEYDPVVLPDGTTHVAAPQREITEPPIQSTSFMSSQLVQFMKASVGMYGASLGDREGKARSGVAEKALQQEGDNSSFDFLDNGGRTVEAVGCDIVELIPKLYSQAEIIQIRDNQNKVLNRAVNQDIAQMDPQKRPPDQKRNYFFTEGSYNVAITAAPSHETLRKESEEKILAMMELADPQDRRPMMLTAMRISGNMALTAVADAIDPPKGKEQEIPAAIQEERQMAVKLIQAQSQEIEALKDTLDNKKLELDSKERQAALDAYVKIKVAEIGAKQQTATVEANVTAEQLKQMWDHAHEVGMAAMGHQQTLEQGEQAHAQGLETQEQAAALEPEPEPTEAQ